MFDYLVPSRLHCLERLRRYGFAEINVSSFEVPSPQAVPSSLSSDACYGLRWKLLLQP